MADLDDDLWVLLDDGAERLPLLSLAEARAAVVLLRRLGDTGGEGAEVAQHLVSALGRRMPAEE
ncbi:hypothetical protein [Streptomyces syringium]|uniref:hypothetical protein n=1 Tax=Streptomyces syringium TaxID=76729 RepID=UPI003AB05F6E